MDRTPWGALVGRLALAVALALVPTAAFGASLTVAGFGDSLTAGPDYLSYLPDEWKTLDFGNPGEESWQGVDRLEGILPGLDADVLVLMEGTNDVRKSRDYVDRSVESLIGMAEQGREADIPVVLAAPPPIFHTGAETFNARLSAISEELEAYAKQEAVPFVDLFSVFSELEDPESFFQPDGVHPWIPGRRLIASEMEPAIRSAAGTSFAPVPEPGAGLLVAVGLGALGAWRRRLRVAL